MTKQCPQCGRLMDYKEYWTTEPCLDEFFEDDIYHVYHERHYCKFCRITLLDKEWKVPKQYRPTQKQLKAIEIINEVLDLNYTPSTKKAAIKFISDNIERSRLVAENTRRSNYIDYFGEEPF